MKEKFHYTFEDIPEMSHFYRKGPTLNLWLSTPDPGWIKEIYYDCYRYHFGRCRPKHEKTFEVVLTNLAQVDGDIIAPRHSDFWRRIDPKPESISTRAIPDILDSLRKNEYIFYHKGFKFAGIKTVPPVIQATPKLRGLIPTLFNSEFDENGLIVCKGFKHPDHLDDFPEVNHRKKLLVCLNEIMEPENRLYCVYIGNFNSFGRFVGSRVMNMRKDYRRALVVDNEETFEADIKNCLPFIMFAKDFGFKLDSDIYEFDYPMTGDVVPRELAKKALLMSLNCDSKKRAAQALQGFINFSDLYRGQYKVTPILQALEKRVPRAETVLYRGRGLELMNKESSCMSKFLSKTISRGVKAYPIHDAVVGKLSDRDSIVENFVEAFTVSGIQPTVVIQ